MDYATRSMLKNSDGDASERLQKLLAVKQNQINSLLEITKAVNNNFSRSALLRIFEFTLQVQLNVGKIALFVYNEEYELVINYGNKGTTALIDIAQDLSKFEVIQDVRNFPNDAFAGFDILMPIIHKKVPLAYLLLGDLNVDKTESFDDKLKFIETISNFILVSLENKRLFGTQLKQERVNKEMELAAEVQAMLIPTDFPKSDHTEVAAHYQPHGSIGGDYYDFIKINDNQVAICMCDVSGKGISAGMLMANFQANLRALVNKNYPLDQLVDHLNFKLKEITKGDRYITMFIGIFDYESRQLNYINAGHNPPLLINDGDVRLLNEGCTILGAFDSLPSIEMKSVYVEENSMLITYTDGLTELENEMGQMYEVDRLSGFAIEQFDLPLKDFIDRLMSDLEKYKGENEYNDDVSILCCKFY